MRRLGMNKKDEFFWVWQKRGMKLPVCTRFWSSRVSSRKLIPKLVGKGIEEELNCFMRIESVILTKQNKSEG